MKISTAKIVWYVQCTSYIDAAHIIIVIATSLTMQVPTL